MRGGEILLPNSLDDWKVVFTPLDGVRLSNTSLGPDARDVVSLHLLFLIKLSFVTKVSNYKNDIHPVR